MASIKDARKLLKRLNYYVKVEKLEKLKKLLKKEKFQPSFTEKTKEEK